MSNKGRFVWYELMTRNQDTALDFYNKVAGWGSVPSQAGDHPYTLLTRNGDPEAMVGGAMTMTEPSFPAELPSHFMGYVGTDDVDATAERAKELGGIVIHGPADIPDVGRFAVLQDPQGGVFSVFQGMEGGEEKTPGHGDFSWHELATTDYAAAFDFYSDLFGWEVDQDMDMGGDMIYRLFKPQGSERSIGGMYNRMPEQPVTAWTYYVMVPDIHASLEAVKGNGGMVLNGPMEVPGGDLVAQCMDPEGTVFALHSSGVASSN